MKKRIIFLICFLSIAPCVQAYDEEVITSKKGSTYVTANMRDNTRRNSEYTFEIGHTFKSRTTLLMEIEGEFEGSSKKKHTNTTLGIEQIVTDNSKLWTALGYHFLIVDGDSDRDQHRPLFKIGYNFANGIFISNRTRFHYDIGENTMKEIRYDNTIGYNMEAGYQFKLNVIINQRDFVNTDYFGPDGDRNSFNTEWRITKNDFMNTGIAPYIELRNEDMGRGETRNFSYTFGASYVF